MNYYQNQNLSLGLVQVLKSVQREIAEAGSLEMINEQNLIKIIEAAAEALGFELNTIERDTLVACLEESNQNFGVLQVFIEDPEVNDIIISAYNKITVQKGRQNFTTNLQFSDREAYLAFVESLLCKAGASYSVKLPIVDAMIDDWIRVHAVHDALCSEGPYLTIRINRFSKITVFDLIDKKLAPEPVIEYLSAQIKSGNTLMVAGEVGSGKTTLVRALAARIPESESVLVIEDTPEIQLEHPQVRYIRTRTSNIEDAGRVAPSECIRAGMRMAMNRIIFGEIRDAEAAESFIDVCASGHPGLSTVHARSVNDAIARLELFLGRSQKGVPSEVLAQQIANSIQVVVHIAVCAETGIRRIQEVVELCGYADRQIRKSCLFKYQISSQNKPEWLVKSHLSYYLGHQSSFQLASLPRAIYLGN